MRKEDWPELLSEYIASKEATAFAWGANDCISFASGAVTAMTGQEPVTVTWDSASKAKRTLNQHGGIAAAITAVIGDPLTTVYLASRGDVGLVSIDGRDLVAVCEGMTWCAPGDHGLVRYPISSAVIAWRVA